MGGQRREEGAMGRRQSTSASKARLANTDERGAHLGDHLLGLSQPAFERLDIAARLGEVASKSATTRHDLAARFHVSPTPTPAAVPGGSPSLRSIHFQVRWCGREEEEDAAGASRTREGRSDATPMLKGPRGMPPIESEKVEGRHDLPFGRRPLLAALVVGARKLAGDAR